jgi:thiaminase/transcriptional activator TenA
LAYQGSLPASSFREYVSQDAFFLRAFARAYALAQAKAADPRTAERIG